MINISTEKSTNKYSKGHTNFSIEYIDAGYHTSNENWAHKKRFLDYNEIIFVLKGNLYLQVNDKQYCLTDNDILVLPQYVNMKSYINSDGSLSFFWLKFHSINFNEFQINNNFFKLSNPYEYIKLFKELVQIAGSNTYPEYAKDIATAHLLCYLSGNCKNLTERNHPDISSVIDWIDENISASLTVEIISTNFKYNKDYLGRVFKANIGTTIKEYINMKQIKKAKDLLLTSEYSIKEISQILNFENANLFIKFFKYHEKISPKKFRNATE
ncbi:MAG: AraC family transcriptional regulator [Clostridiales bacterium]|nr:AraC family transcriptional regulator [Clostridiales bacterium]